MAQMILALYDDLTVARQAAQALVEAGLERNQLSLATSDPDETYAAQLEAEAFDEAETVRGGAADGAVAGGAVGGLAGLFLGLAAFSIPGVGPLLFAGPLWTAALGAGAGSAAGSVAGALVEAGVPENEAAYYEEGIRQGHTLLGVNVTGEQEMDKTQSVLTKFGPLEIGAEAEAWQEAGWEAPDEVPDRFIPSTDDESDQHKYATGAMGEDLYGRRASRDRPPLPTYDRDDTAA